MNRRRASTEDTRPRVGAWVLVACGAVLGVLIAMVLVHVLMGGSLGLGV